MEKKEEVNINFFKKVWYSIINFEQYPFMAVEGLKRAIKYLIMLVAIATIFATIGTTLQMKTTVGNMAQYIQDNIPEFTYSNGNISLESQETIVLDDFEYTGTDKIVINTTVETEEEKEQIEQENSITGTVIYFFNNQIVLKAQAESGETVRQVYTYNDFITNYTGKYIEQFDKTEFVQYLTSSGMRNFYIQYGISMFIYLLILNVLVALLDTLEIALIGWITATIARIRLKFVAIYNMAIYSLTLPMVLNIIYIVINYFIDFTITYFQVAYITIAYIYLAAVIFILKDDIIKKLQEVEKIKQEQLKIRREIKQQEEDEKKDKKDKEKSKDENENKDEKDDNKNDEPQGSEA